MGVLACGRRGCDKIMCDRMILGNESYICDECWKDLLAYKDTWDPDLVTSVRSMIENFMDTVPGACTKNNTRESVEEAFRHLTVHARDKEA